jgi:hypothetical protein
MIICYFNIKCVAIFPMEADSPLIIDPDAVLPPANSFEGLYPITGRNPQIVQGPCAMEIKQPPTGNPFDCMKPGHILIFEQLLCFFIPERPDHKR